MTSMSSARPRSRVWHRCTWACTNPGMTRQPEASTTVSAVIASDPGRTAAIRPPSTTTSPTKGSASALGTTTPPRTTRSATGALL